MTRRTPLLEGVALLVQPVAGGPQLDVGDLLVGRQRSAVDLAAEVRDEGRGAAFALRGVAGTMRSITSGSPAANPGHLFGGASVVTREAVADDQPLGVVVEAGERGVVDECDRRCDLETEEVLHGRCRIDHG